MKLSEIKLVTEAKLHRVELSDVDIWDRAGLEPVDLEIEFDYEEPSYSNHPYGEGTAREDHPAVIDISAVKLLKDANIYDDNEEKVLRVLAKGTDLLKEKDLVTKQQLKWLEDQVAEKMQD